ncbi:MAG: hydroxyacylglutathione hydrolase [Pseudomonadota bacterium]|nr:hydroxyacylglutathione hydrolase [Pseudomonadota bacterium]
MTYRLKAIPSLTDNYIWLLINDTTATAIIIDPGSSQPCEDFLDQENICPVVILVTHHHWDHVNGIEKLVQRYGLPVYGPAKEFIPCQTNDVKAADRFRIEGFDINFHVMDLSGHTAGHIGYLTERELFCGDTLFSAGCGRLFDGTAAQLHAAIQRIARLPPDTIIYCAHEYTLDNLRFAQAVEPDNPAIQQRLHEVKKLRENNLPSLPFTIEQEMRYNPFLRTDKESIMQAVAQHSGQDINNSRDCFRFLRMWKDGF